MVFRAFAVMSLLAAVLCGLGCDDLKVEGTEFECETDADCLSGFSCLPSGNDPGVNVCTAQDVSSSNDASGTDAPLVCSGACTFARGQGECQNGTCVLVSCDSGYADCDENPANGCEVNVLSNAAHCNACNQRCVGSDCVAGSCTTETAEDCTNFFDQTQCSADKQCAPINDTDLQCTAFGTTAVGQTCSGATDCVKGALCINGQCATPTCTPFSAARPCPSSEETCVRIGEQSQINVGLCAEDLLGKACDANDGGRSCTIITPNYCQGFADDQGTPLPHELCTRSCDTEACPAGFYCTQFGTGNGGTAGVCLSGRSCVGLQQCFVNECPTNEQSCLQNCLNKAGSTASDLFLALNNCAASNGCTDNDCVQANCSAESTACSANNISD